MEVVEASMYATWDIGQLLTAKIARERSLWQILPLRSGCPRLVRHPPEPFAAYPRWLDGRVLQLFQALP